MADLDPVLSRLIEHRDFSADVDEYEGLLEEDDIVMDVVILARIKRPMDVGTGTSALLIITDNDVDDLMTEGMLSRALALHQTEIRDADD